MYKSFLVSLFLCALVSFGYSQSNNNLRVPTLSPRSIIEQEVGLTRVNLNYARPSAKGRKIFGGLVPFGEIWRTGANSATRLTFTEDVMIAGNPLKAGTYALYTIPGKDEWTIIIHSNTKMRSIQGRYKQEDDVFRFNVKPQMYNEHVETFTIGFADIKTASVNIELTWEKTSVKFPVIFNINDRIDKQISDLTAAGKMSPFNLFRAAEYYFQNGRDLDKALNWIDSSIEKSPKNFRFGLMKAKIEHKMGKKSQALKTIEMANGWAKERNNANYIKQTQDFWDSIK